MGEDFLAFSLAPTVSESFFAFFLAADDAEAEAEAETDADSFLRLRDFATLE